MNMRLKKIQIIKICDSLDPKPFKLMAQVETTIASTWICLGRWAMEEEMEKELITRVRKWESVDNVWHHTHH